MPAAGSGRRSTTSPSGSRPAAPGRGWSTSGSAASATPPPLRLDGQVDQPDPAGSFRITPTAEGDLDVTMDGQPQYQVETRPRRLVDFEPTCWWHQTSPTSHFTQSLICSMLTGDGRVTLSDRTLVETTRTGRHERTLTGDAQVRDAYRVHFGIALDQLPSSPRSRPAVR